MVKRFEIWAHWLVTGPFNKIHVSTLTTLLPPMGQIWRYVCLWMKVQPYARFLKIRYCWIPWTKQRSAHPLTSISAILDFLKKFKKSFTGYKFGKDDVQTKSHWSYQYIFSHASLPNLHLIWHRNSPHLANMILGPSLTKVIRWIFHLITFVRLGPKIIFAKLGEFWNCLFSTANLNRLIECEGISQQSFDVLTPNLVCVFRTPSWACGIKFVIWPLGALQWAKTTLCLLRVDAFISIKLIIVSSKLPKQDVSSYLSYTLSLVNWHKTCYQCLQSHF